LCETITPNLSFLIFLVSLGVIAYAALTYLFLGNELSLLLRPVMRSARR
jgi:hypothetical protein